LAVTPRPETPAESPQAEKNGAVAGTTPRQILVGLVLVANPKAARVRPFVARIKQDGQLEFLKAAVPWFSSNSFVGGKYRLNVGDLVITRRDTSSHKNICMRYTLYRVTEGGLDEIAWIMFYNRTAEFSSKELEEIYAVTEDDTSRAIAALVQYARTKRLLG